MSRPIIGITTGAGTYESQSSIETFNSYMRAVENAGGQPVCLDPLHVSVQEIPDVVGKLHGLLLSGGRDVHPRHYEPNFDESTIREVVSAFKLSLDEERDELEILLARMACNVGMPIFGICRGFQVLNVVLGGGMIKDIQTEIQHKADGDGTSAKHAVEVVPDSGLARMIPGLKEVNSRHHQGICAAELSEHLRAAAYSADGIIEAVESKTNPHVSAVQWHPERQVDEYIYEPCRSLFSELVTASGIWGKTG